MTTETFFLLFFALLNEILIQAYILMWMFHFPISFFSYTLFLLLFFWQSFHLSFGNWRSITFSTFRGSKKNRKREHRGKSFSFNCQQSRDPKNEKKGSHYLLLKMMHLQFSHIFHHQKRRLNLVRLHSKFYRGISLFCCIHAV